jgi:hypothetical protein
MKTLLVFMLIKTNTFQTDKKNADICLHFFYKCTGLGTP